MSGESHSICFHVIIFFLLSFFLYVLYKCNLIFLLTYPTTLPLYILFCSSHPYFILCYSSYILPSYLILFLSLFSGSSYTLHLLYLHLTSFSCYVLLHIYISHTLPLNLFSCPILLSHHTSFCPAHTTRMLFLRPLTLIHPSHTLLTLTTLFLTSHHLIFNLRETTFHQCY